MGNEGSNELSFAISFSLVSLLVKGIVGLWLLNRFYSF